MTDELHDMKFTPARALKAWRRVCPLQCSFCGRDEKSVAHLVAGAAGYICGDCIAKCVAILKDHGDPGLSGKPR